MIEEITAVVKTILESDIKNVGAIVLSVVIGAVMYLWGIRHAQEKPENPHEDLKNLLAQVQAEGAEHLTLQKFQMIHELLNQMENQQDEFRTTMKVLEEIVRHLSGKVETIHTSVEIIKSTLGGSK